MQRNLLIAGAVALSIATAFPAWAGPATDIPENLIVEPSPELTLVADYESFSEDLEIMAHLLCGECQSGSRELQEAVGSVVLNRVASDDFPDTIPDVVFQRGQYSCTWDGNYDRTPTERNWEVARYLLENGSQIPENVVFQAQFKQGRVWKKISNQIFCYGR